MNIIKRFFNNNRAKEIPAVLDLKIDLIDSDLFGSMLKSDYGGHTNRSETIQSHLVINDEKIVINLYSQNSVVFHKKIESENYVKKITIGNKVFIINSKDDSYIQSGSSIVINNSDICEYIKKSLKEDYYHKILIELDNSISLSAEWID